jgi:hypothetical protein
LPNNWQNIITPVLETPEDLNNYSSSNALSNLATENAAIAASITFVVNTSALILLRAFLHISYCDNSVNSDSFRV